MKSLKYYMSVLSLLLIVTSCDEQIIDLTERDSLPTEIAVASLEGMETSMLAVYERARSLHENNEISCYKQCGTDIVTSGTNMVDVGTAGMRGMMEYLNAFDATSDQVENIFNGLYQAIDRANVVIKFGNNYVSNSAEEEARKNAIIGEAYTLRANAYLELAERWDNAVISELAETVDDVKFTAELSSQEDLFNLVVSDTEAAIPLLRSRVETGDVGKPSKDMAYLIQMKAHMWLGNYGEAAEAAENVIAQGAQLQPLDGIFGLEGGKTGEENNEEIIFSWVFSPTNQNRPQRTVQMYVPLYDRVPGIARSLAQGARPWSRLSPSEYYWSLFDSDDDGSLDDEEDGRIDAWHKRYWILDDSVNIVPGFGLEVGDTVTQEYLMAWAGNDREARYLDPTCTKNWEDGTYGRTEAEAEGFRNVIVYRLAQAYIIGAEAHWRNNNEPRALELLNTIRERAFGDSDHNFTSITEETIIEEHARELGHEGHRWAFLKRLGILIERVEAHNPSAAPNIQPRHVRWPIPQNFVSQVGVDQNPDW